MTKLNINDVLESILKDTDEIFKASPKELHKPDIYLLSLLLSLYDITTDIYYLTKQNSFISIPSLVRNFMDTYIDILLIQEDKENIFHFTLKDYKLKLKSVKSKLKEEYQPILNLSNDKIKRLVIKKDELESDIEILEEQISGNKLDNIKIKYKKVGMLWFYETFYNDLCSHTHNSPEIIEFRHIETKNNKVNLKYHQEYDFDFYRRYYFLLLNYFHNSLVVVNELLNFKQNILIDKIENTIKEYSLKYKI
jgi:Family of unknown function (DUF5677)